MLGGVKRSRSATWASAVVSDCDDWRENCDAADCRISTKGSGPRAFGGGVCRRDLSLTGSTA